MSAKRKLTTIERESARIVARMFEDAGHDWVSSVIDAGLRHDATEYLGVGHLPEEDGRLPGRARE